MRRLRDLSVRAKLWWSFALAFCLIATIGTIGVLQLRTHNEFTTVLAEITVREVVLLGDIDRSLAEHRVLAQRRVETADFRQLAEISDAMVATDAAIESSLALYGQIADASEERITFDGLLRDWKAYQESLAGVLRQLEIGNVAGGLGQFDQQTLPRLAQATDKARALTALAEAEATGSAETAHDLYVGYLAAIIATMVLAAIAGGAGLIWVQKEVSLPIRAVSDAMRRLTAGDDSVVIAGEANRRDEIGTLIAAAAGYRDSLIEQRRWANEADEERRRFQLAVKSMPVGLCLFDADHRLVVFNNRYREMYKLPDSLARPGVRWHDLVEFWMDTDTRPAMDRDAFYAFANEVSKQAEPFSTTMQMADGRIFNIIQQPVANGGWIATHEDVTARHEAEQEIARLAQEAERERERLDAAIRNMPIGLSMFDCEKRLLYANARYSEVYDVAPEVAKPGTPLATILKARTDAGAYIGDNPERYVAEITEKVGRGVPWHEVAELLNGRVVSMVFQPLADGGWVGTHEDITERRKAEAQIAYMAHYDPLTDLPNRILFRKRLEEALTRKAGAGGVAVLYLDLDHFKQVNDTLGHLIGDRLLTAAARRLAGCVRERDTVGRLGGDEFAVIQVTTRQPASARSLAQRIIDEMAKPFVIDGHQMVIGASVGIAVADAEGVAAQELIKNSDIALYRAKSDGRGVYRFFEPEMDARMQARRRLEMDLRAAVEAQAFEVHYQPQIKLETNRITGFEALLRWPHPERGYVPPSEFIPLAEETGLIVPIGEWVLRQACQDAKRWPADIRVAVNLSAVQFRNARLMKAVIGALDASGLSPSRLELEVTESVLLVETDATLVVLHQLKELGAHISMDDFGTGYSSLSYLQRFPFDKVKIDRRFIMGVTDAGNSLAIVRAVTGLSRSLGIDTTAEGVETRDQLDRVRQEGCTEVQGFLVGKPMPQADALGLVKQYRDKSVAAA